MTSCPFISLPPTFQQYDSYETGVWPRGIPDQHNTVLYISCLFKIECQIKHPATTTTNGLNPEKEVMGRGGGCSRFREQVAGLGRLWESWTEAEQVVVVYSLLRRLPPVPARFLLNLLTHAHQADPSPHDLAHAEAAANDP
ncbi:hypothetical protein Pmani_021677, partial [Petrolisthes manimaculis]